MKKKQFFAYLILFQAAFFTAFAQDPTPGPETPVIQKTKGNRLNTYQKVNGIENWNHFYDLSGYKKGTYNLIIKGVDKSGNIYYEGPINILIDPASDIPVVNINNPTPEMRVGGKNLNIVGTCVDDDAVSYVEVKIDDGDYRRAEGKEFWSYYLNTTELIDGRHTISARGMDINGKEGKPVSRIFNLDTANPVNAVTSHSNGILVSGNVTIKGQVTDLNGVNSLALSQDGGKEFTPLALSYNKKENSYLFKLAINTVKMKDGPHVYWFKSMDKTGSIGHSAFLFFVDNTNPRITILKPAEGEKVNGRTFVSGKTTDEIGITRFTYQLEKETGEIPLIPGNPYWIKEFDFSSLKGKTADITFRAEDITGNITVSRVKFPLDREADLPVITIVAPENNALVTGDVLLSGFTSDDDGIKEISYALDGDKPVNREAGDAFSFIIDEVKPGKHKLVVRGTDIYGVTGKETAVEFTRAGAKPVININTLRMDKEEFPFIPGIEVLRDKNPVFAGQVQSDDKIKNAVYRFKEQEFKNLPFKKGQGTSFDFEITAGKEIGLGINTLDIQVTDIFDRITEFNTFIYVRNYTRINAEPGIYITDARADSKRVRITAADPLTCLFVGDPVRGAEFIPDTSIARISREGNSLKVYPQETGVSEKVRIKVTTIYDEIFESDELVYVTDNKGPELKITAPATGQWCRDTLTITGTATDPSGIAAVEYSLDNQATFSGLPFNIDGKMAEFSREISLSGREDGNVTLFIRAVDKSDNISQKAFSLNKDTAPAEITILAPRQDDSGLPDKLLIMGRADDTGKIREIQLSSDNSEYKKIADTSFFRQEISLSDYPVLPSAFFIKAIDYSGNSAVATVALPAAVPSSMYVQGGDGDYRTDTSQKETGKPVLVLAGTDSKGEVHYEAGFRRTDADQPPDFPWNRSTKLLVSGILKLKGTIESSLQAAELFYGEEDISGKIKVTFDKKSGLSVFNLTLDLRKTEDGGKVFWFKCIDTAGGIHYAPFAFRLDNTPPVIRILSPAEGDTVNGAWIMAGFAADSIAVRSLTWQYGKVKEEIPLFPGNPYWSRNVGLEGMTGSSGTINLTATDLAGNVSVLNYKFTVDKNSDLPVATILYPANRAQIQGNGVSVLGISRDDDGIDKIIYTIDKNEAKEIKVKDAFSLELTGLATGAHTVACVPVDINGIQGKSTAVEFTLMGDLPHVQVSRVVRQDWEVPWSAGILVPDDSGKALLEGVCSAEAAEGEFSLLDEPGTKLVLKTVKGSAEKSFTIPLTSVLPYGRIDVTVKVKDIYNREQVLKSFFYKTAQDDPASIIDEEALYFADSGIKGNKVVLDEIKALTGYFNGRKIRAITLEPASDFLHISYDNQYIEIKPVKDGISADTKIKVTTVNGREFYSSAFRFFADHNKPVIRLESPLTGSWVQNRITIAGTASDNLGITRLEYSLDKGVSFRPVKFQESEGGIKFSADVSTGLDDGNISLLIRALDETGNSCEENINIKQDTQQAQVSLITPLAEDTVNGKITVVGTAEDAGTVAYAEFSDNGTDFRKIGGTNIFYFDLDFSGYETLPEKFIIQVHDKSGNIARFIPPFKVDTVIDKPVATIQVPENGAVLKNDFVISGMVFDDDGVKTIYYQLDDNPPGTLPGSNNFEIPIKLPDITDNDHIVKVWAEDLGGVKGDVVQSTFIISKAEPVSRLITPGIDTTAQGKVTLEGTSADENGIKAVYISFDNANTYNLAEGQETWSYALDTTVLADGTYSLFIKAVDRTDTEGISTTLINIDNTPPEISLDVPADGDIISGNILFDGRAFDNIALTELKAIVSPLDEAAADERKIFDLPVKGIFSQQERLDNFRPGWYNVRLEARDKADNTYYISRNVRIRETVSADKVDIIFPAEGSLLNGYFTLSGKVRSGSRIENVVVYLDDKPAEVVAVNDYGFYKLDFGTGNREGEIAVADGQHSLQVEARLEGNVVLMSDKRSITYSREGGYVTITSMDVGAYITNRPWLRGTAGYYLDRVDKSEGELYKAYLAEIRENRIERVEVSMDNGRTFRKAAGTVKWKFRLETQELTDGELPIIVRAVYNNQGAVTKTILMVDDTPPAVKLLTPEEGKRFNEELVVLGTAQDDNGVDEVYVNLRRGDKAGYSVPSFIQGMYVDGHMLGATDWEAGLGLTFFDQVVKLQANIGYAPYWREGSIYPERFFGTTVSVKLLANIADIPFSALFRSHDWDFLSMCVAIGANFTYFSMSPENFTFYNPDIPYVIIGALLSQIEFPKFKLKDWVVFNTYSFYLEGAASFISSDVFPIIEFNLSFGFRLGLL